MPSGRAARPGFVAVALGAAALAAAGAVALAGFAAERLGRGFRFDWYVYAPPAAQPAATAARMVGGTAALAAALGVVLGLLATYVLWDALVRRGRLRPVRHPQAWSRSVAALPVLAGALVLPLAAAVAVAAGPALPARGLQDVMLVAVPASAALAAFGASLATWSALARGRILPSGQGTNVVGGISAGAARFPKSTLAVLLVVTLVLGQGMSLITTDVDVADVLPRGDHNATAAKNLTTKFKSAFTQQVTLQFHTASGDAYARDARRLPDRQTEANPYNISDELYVRALGQATEFIKSHPDSPFVASVALPEFYALINWTIAGGQDADPGAFSIPATDREGSLRYAAVDDVVWRAIPDAALAVVSHDREQTAVVFSVDPQEPLSSKEIGERALLLRDAYVAWAETDPAAYKVFTGDNAPLFTVDLPIANAHSSELAGKDLRRLIPPIAAFILVSLFLAFRHPGAILAAFTALATAVVWTFGAMGYMRIPLNTLNLTLVPLIMGVGIDYGIHIVNEYQERRARGDPVGAAFAHVGSTGGLALLMGTLTTIGGLLVMVVSPSLLIAQLGLLGVIGMASVFILAVTWIPAFITVAARDARAHRYKPSPLMAGLAGAVARNRIVVLILLVALTSAAAVAAQRIGKEEFGDPPRNWLAGDPLRQEHETTLQNYYGTDEVKANVLVFEGDILDPAAHTYMRAIESSLKEPQRDRIFHDRIRTLPFLMETWLTVKGGAPGAGQYLVFEHLREEGLPSQDPYPQTREEMAAEVEEIFASPLYQFGNLFVDHPDDRTAIMLVTVRARTYEDAEVVWRQVWSAVDENEALRPEGLKVAFVGNTATNYLFIAKELPWVKYMSIAATLIVVSLVALATRSLRSTLTVAALSVGTGLWWLAILPSLGIGLAITLTLPLVFIFAIGSDYGLHLSMSVHRGGSLLETFRTTGKAVLFSFITTFGAFLVYTQVANLAVRRTMVATTVATVVIFVATMLVVPLLWGTSKYLRADGPPQSVPVAAPARRSVVAVREAPPERP